ncbi:hypothetical protein OROHE_008502 [Orobanche hederae]
MQLLLFTMLFLLFSQHDLMKEHCENEGKSRNDEPLAMFLRNGDIVLMSGEARDHFHVYGTYDRISESADRDYQRDGCSCFYLPCYFYFFSQHDLMKEHCENEGKSRNDEPLAMFLRNSDIVLMSGEARDHFHGVIVDGTYDRISESADRDYQRDGCSCFYLPCYFYFFSQHDLMKEHCENEGKSRNDEPLAMFLRNGDIVTNVG